MFYDKYKKYRRLKNDYCQCCNGNMSSMENVKSVTRSYRYGYNACCVLYLCELSVGFLSSIKVFLRHNTLNIRHYPLPRKSRYLSENQRLIRHFLPFGFLQHKYNRVPLLDKTCSPYPLYQLPTGIFYAKNELSVQPN